MSTTYKFSLYVQVSDEQNLYDAARSRAIDERIGWNGTPLIDLIGTRDEPDVGGCLRMLLDPGASPAGTEILDSEVE